MGRVRVDLVKRSARQVIEKYFSRLTMDFDTNKKVLDEVAVVPSKRLRNKIAGYVTHLMKRIERGPVRGISLKLQEEERERRLDFVPERSALDLDTTEVDPDTAEMLRSIDFPELPGVVTVQPQQQQYQPRRERREGGERKKREPREKKAAAGADAGAAAAAQPAAST